MVHEPIISVPYRSVLRPNRSKEMRDEQVYNSFIEREVQSIIMQDHHIEQEALMLKVKAFIRHVKGLGHYTLGDSNRHPKKKY